MKKQNQNYHGFNFPNLVTGDIFIKYPYNGSVKASMALLTKSTIAVYLGSILISSNKNLFP